MQRHQHVDSALRRLSYLKSEVELRNAINLTDLNIHSENFYRDFLNLLFGYNLQNINILEPNAAAIDLGDQKSSIAIQVTSDSSLAKVKKTVKAFEKKKLYEQYSRLIVLRIGKSTSHRAQKIGTTFKLDCIADIWDIKALVRKIGDLGVPQQARIVRFLEDELHGPPATLPNELSTFAELIEVLSDEAQPGAGQGFTEEPDPKKKIEHRFAEHSSFLKSQYRDQYAEYGRVLEDVLSNGNFGQPRYRRLGLYLKEHSDKALTASGGDPRLALDHLTERLVNHLSSGFSETAIRFFLVDQLIRCNVFPNASV